MNQSEAIDLISGMNVSNESTQKWADLGCGSGLFTYALASLLKKNSRIVAIDKKDQTPIKSRHREVSIDFVQVDFIEERLPESAFDGILMANSLHYVKDKRAFIQKMSSLLKANGQMVIIEYDTEKSNLWVPHPISFTQLKELFKEVGGKEIRKIGERPSRYKKENMYAADIRF